MFDILRCRRRSPQSELERRQAQLRQLEQRRQGLRQHRRPCSDDGENKQKDISFVFRDVFFCVIIAVVWKCFESIRRAVVRLFRVFQKFGRVFRRLCLSLPIIKL